MKLRDQKNKLKRSTVLIGPLPPPVGGARMSFELFHDYFQGNSDADWTFHDLPRVAVDENGNLSRVNHWATFIGIIRLITKMRRAQNIIIFASAGFGFSYALLVSIFAKLLGSTVSIRLFGGHPALRLQSVSGSVRRAIWTAARLVDRIIVETGVGKTEFPAQIRQRVAVITGYRRREEPTGSVPPTGFRFIYCGRVAKQKGMESLLGAWSIVREDLSDMPHSPELHVVGPIEEQLQSSLQDVDGVVVYGALAHNVLLDLLAVSDAFVFPSVYANEGHPGSVIEAFMCGLPVIASDLPGPSEIVHDGRNGLLFRAGDTCALAQCMVDLARDNQRRLRLAENAKQSFDEFDHLIVIPKLLDAMEVDR